MFLITGAGKTTTMAMLTAEFPPSSGDATLAGFSITKEPQKIRRRIGYCPQFDAHFAQLSGRNHVELYASIKGIPREFVKEAVAMKLKEVGLSDYDSDKVTSSYSGGMRRRLSLACATIGQPQIVFLDECSTGVDPVARREIWQLVSDMVSGRNVAENERTSVILTTHSMEECEALCPRIGIMANGRLRCLGSAQHLKNKFGQGYQVELKTRIADREDDDYVRTASILAATVVGRTDEEAAVAHSLDLVFNKDQAVSALQVLTQDSFLSDMISVDHPTGYGIWKDSTSPAGVSLDSLVTFATIELRMRSIADFIAAKFPSHVLRERQDTKARYEVSAVGTRISSIFETIETNKGILQLADYGVSQTSLEQVFNMHAAEAEKLKQGRDDH
jgi:ATP-binding cassette, subfamily A (ABC1), member 3